MRIALVSPYSWTYQGGVNRHVEALAEQFISRGDHVRVLAPWDPPGVVSRRLHRSEPELREAPGLPGSARADRRVSGRTAPSPTSPRSRRGRSRSDASCAPATTTSSTCTSPRRRSSAGTPRPSAARPWSAPSTPTRPRPSRTTSPRCSARGAGFNQLSARIAVSEAAAWTGRRWFGGEYTIVPNGVDVEAAPQGPKPPSDELRLLFVGRAEERKGLPVLLAAFQALVEHVPSRLTVVGADPEDDLPPRRRPGRPVSHRRARQGVRLGALAPARQRPTCSARPPSPARASAWS